MMKPILIVILPMILFSCEFNISEKKLKKTFKERELAPKIQKLKIGDRNINYAFIDRNKDNLVVFIHGSPGSWNAFLNFFKNDSLLEEVDVLSIDRPGFGDSDRGWPEPSMEKQSRLMEAVVSQFGHSNKILVGHSLGGPLIARMAMDFPDLAKGLVFVAPSIDPDLEKYEWYRSWIKTKAGGFVTPKDFWVSNEEILPLKEELEKMLPLWENIKASSIVLQGKKDMLVPWQNGEFAKKMLPDSMVEVRYLKGVNHFIPWTHPETMVQAIFDLSN